MRLTIFILSFGIALACVPASASTAVFGTTIASACPIYEGYPDCHSDGLGSGTTYSSGSWSHHARHHR